MSGGKYGVFPPSDGGILDRIQDQMKAKQKPEKLTWHVIVASMLGSTSISAHQGDSKTSRKAKSSSGSGIETGQTEHLEVPFVSVNEGLKQKLRS